MSANEDLAERIAVRAHEVTKVYELGELLSIKRTFGRFTRRGEHVGTPFEALHEVSFDVERGECVSIMGSNGSGKSTVLQIIAGLTIPTSGYAAVRGRVSGTWTRRSSATRSG
jgi:ABC-type polysaccharide/polyol phosphate transport system ATPase subunit